MQELWMQMDIISSLPREIILHVLAFLPAVDIIGSAVRVSKLFWELGVDPILWKRFCEREFGINLTGNVYPPHDWQAEYFTMRAEWEAITGNGLRVDVKYDGMVDMMFDDDRCIVFTNIRPRSNQNLAPITTQSQTPLRPLPIGDFSVGYYELELEETGEEQMIGLGLARNNYLDAMPGWKKGSIGYHGDDGRVFIGCGFGRNLTEPWVKGDIYGCGVDFRRKYVFFTKNGALLGTYPSRSAEGLYPTIGSRTEGESIRVNFGKKPFSFDVFKYQHSKSAPPPEGSVAIPYSQLVYRSKPAAPSVQPPYDDEDDVEDEDNEFDDKGMNKASQYFNSVLRVLINSDDYPNDDGSVESLVAVLRGQMQEGGLNLPPDMTMSDLREALSTQIQFNKQSALLAYFMRVYESGNPASPSAILDSLLPTDEFPKTEIIKCIATLLLDDYRDDHPLVLNTLNRGRALFNFQPPAGMTITQERGQLSLVLSREIQAHERERRTKRREILKSLRADDANCYYYETPIRDFSLLLNEPELIPNNNTNNTDNNNNINNNNDTNNNNNNNDEDEILPLEALNSIISTPPITADNNTGDQENIQSAVDQDDPSVSPVQFQELLQSHVDLLSDFTIVDEDARITGAICQWYTTLNIDMKPDMQVSVERVRLIKILAHLHKKVDEHIEEHNAKTLISRVGLKVKRFCRNFSKSLNFENTTRLSFFMMLGFVIASRFHKGK